MSARPLRIALVHPELGLGGAERFVLDAALALQEHGHAVRLYVARLDPSRAFSDATSGRLDVRVVARRMPVRLFGGLQAPLTLAALSWVGARARFDETPDVTLVDVASGVIPWLRLLGHRRVVFYGHYPDLLQGSHTGLRRFYRQPLDTAELIGLRQAHHLLVNSQFTLEAYQSTFPQADLSAARVLYPAIADEVFHSIPPLAPQGEPHFNVLCLGRFTPEKRHDVALAAFAQALRSSALAPRMRLTLAGGYDERFIAQKELLASLRQQATDLGVSEQVALEPSITDTRKKELLAQASVLLYPPVAEHFGLVPLEAMAAARPVIACDSGGPRETVRHGRTGYLVQHSAEEFAAALKTLLADPAHTSRLGQAGRALVAEEFSFRRFSANLEREIQAVAAHSV